MFHLTRYTIVFSPRSVVGAEALGRAFGSSNCLQVLRFNRNDGIGNDGIIAFCTASTKTDAIPFVALRVLDVGQCKIGSDGITALVDLLLHRTNSNANKNDQSVPSLHLLLNSNPLQPTSASSLRSLLECQPTVSLLHKLELRNCELGNDGIKTLFHNMNKSGLVVLDLADNGFTTDGAVALAECLTRSLPDLQELIVRGNACQTDGAAAIANALQDHPLQSLDMSQTSCCRNGANALLQTAGKLQKLRLFDNKLGDATEPFVIESRIVLQELDLGGNNIRAADMIRLLEGVGAVPKDAFALRVLEIGGNEANEQVEAAIRAVQSKFPELDVARDKPVRSATQG